MVNHSVHISVIKYFIGPKFHFLVIDWISLGLIPFFRITDRPHQFCLKKRTSNFLSCSLQNEKTHDTLAEQNIPAKQYEYITASSPSDVHYLSGVARTIIIVNLSVQILTQTLL